MPTILTKASANPYKVEVYLPAKDRNGDDVPEATYEKHLGLVRAALAELAGGGHTEYDATGYWGDKPEATKVLVVYVVRSVRLSAVVNGALAAALAAYATECRQEVAGLVCDGEWYCVRGAA